jgi:hypothetical protein
LFLKTLDPTTVRSNVPQSATNQHSPYRVSVITATAASAPTDIVSMRTQSSFSRPNDLTDLPPTYIEAVEINQQPPRFSSTFSSWLKQNLKLELIYDKDKMIKDNNKIHKKCLKAIYIVHSTIVN